MDRPDAPEGQPRHRQYIGPVELDRVEEAGHGADQQPEGGAGQILEGHVNGCGINDRRGLKGWVLPSPTCPAESFPLANDHHRSTLLRPSRSRSNETSTATDEEALISRGRRGSMVIHSFPFGCTTEHVDAVISTSSYREAGNCGVVRRGARLRAGSLPDCNRGGG